MTRFLDPKNDYAFKKIFGSEDHKDILIDFLNSLLKLEGDKRIQSVEFLSPTQAPLYDGKKISILDILCKDGRDIKYIVEMQVAKTANFLNRTVFYASRTYVGQLGDGIDYAKLKSVIVVAILDHIEFKDTKECVSLHSITNHQTGKQSFDAFMFYFLELPKFKKESNELETLEDKWIYFLKNTHKDNDIPENCHGTIVEKAYGVLERYHYTEMQMHEYLMAALAREDFEHTLQVESEKAHARGREEGLEEGEKAANLKNAAAMLIKGLPDNLIIEITEISEQDLANLKQEIKQ